MSEYVYRQPLFTKKGRLKEPGWTPEDIFAYNKERLPFASRRREWEFYQVTGSRFAFRVSYGHGPGAGRAEAVLVDFETGEKVRSGRLRMLPGDGMDLDFAPGEPHTVKYEDDKLLLSLGFDGERRRVVVRSDRFDAEIIAPETGDAIVTALPLAKRTYFLYQMRRVYTDLGDHLHMHKLDYPMDEGTFMVLSSGRGVLPFRSRRIWAAGAWETESGTLGVSLGEDNGPDDAPTENALFFNGEIQKLGRVNFKFDHGKLDSTWRMTDMNRRIRLEFRPVTEDTDKLNLGVAQIQRHRLYGRLSGTVRLSDEEELRLEDRTFFVEYADDRW